MNIQCQNCQHWTELHPELRQRWIKGERVFGCSKPIGVGKCSILDILTEWEAGTDWRTQTHIKYCEHYEQIP